MGKIESIPMLQVKSK